MEEEPYLVYDLSGVRRELRRDLVPRLPSRGSAEELWSLVFHYLQFLCLNDRVSAEGTTANAIATGGRRREADWCCEQMVSLGNLTEGLPGRINPPVMTGDLAYRVLSSTEETREDPELAGP